MGLAPPRGRARAQEGEGALVFAARVRRAAEALEDLAAADDPGLAARRAAEELIEAGERGVPTCAFGFEIDGGELQGSDRADAGHPGVERAQGVVGTAGGEQGVAMGEDVLGLDGAQAGDGAAEVGGGGGELAEGHLGPGAIVHRAPGIGAAEQHGVEQVLGRERETRGEEHLAATGVTGVAVGAVGGRVFEGREGGVPVAGRLVGLRECEAGDGVAGVGGNGRGGVVFEHVGADMGSGGPRARQQQHHAGEKTLGDDPSHRARHATVRRGDAMEIARGTATVLPAGKSPRPPSSWSARWSAYRDGTVNGPCPDGPPPDKARRLMAEQKATNIVWHQGAVTREDRGQLNGHKGCTVWLTGLSGSGKSTIAVDLEKRLLERGVRTYILDGDNIRHGLNKNLGFSPEDRTENIRRIGEVAKLFTDAGLVTLTAFISPYRADRDQVRAIMSDGDFVEVYVDCPVEVCEQRDVKGLYKKARAGEIKEFTGISAPYEEPLRAELTIKTAGQSVEESAKQILAHLERAGVVPTA